MELQGKVAAVTGAAQGIGWATACRLSRAGASVALLDLDGPRVRKAAAELRSARAWTCDVRDLERVGAVFGQINAGLGPVDILVNNAGVWRHTPVLATTELGWDEVFAVNAKGVLFCSQAVAPGMIQRRSGKIVTIASVAGLGGSANWSAYCASKAAAISLTLALAEALGEHGVQANAVCPGATRTALLDTILEAEPGSGFAWVHSPDEVAGEVLRLVVPFAQTTTGQVVTMKPATSALGLPVCPSS